MGGRAGKTNDLQLGCRNVYSQVNTPRVLEPSHLCLASCVHGSAEAWLCFVCHFGLIAVEVRDGAPGGSEAGQCECYCCWSDRWKSSLLVSWVSENCCHALLVSSAWPICSDDVGHVQLKVFGSLVPAWVPIVQQAFWIWACYGGMSVGVGPSADNGFQAFVSSCTEFEKRM